MMLRIASLVILAAFALAPLAQAVECIMHVPAATAAHDGGGHPAEGHAGMPVAECFTAAMDGILSAPEVVKVPVFTALPVAAFMPVVRPLPRMVLAEKRWRGPPDNVLMTNRRLRI